MLLLLVVAPTVSLPKSIDKSSVYIYNNNELYDVVNVVSLMFSAGSLLNGIITGCIAGFKDNWELSNFP